LTPGDRAGAAADDGGGVSADADADTHTARRQREALVTRRAFLTIPHARNLPDSLAPTGITLTEARDGHVNFLRQVRGGARHTIALKQPGHVVVLVVRAERPLRPRGSLL